MDTAHWHTQVLTFFLLHSAFSLDNEGVEGKPEDEKVSLPVRTCF